jgi:hypothetical protein
MARTKLWTRRILVATCLGTLLSSVTGACASGGESDGDTPATGGSAATDGGSGAGGTGATDGGGTGATGGGGTAGGGTGATGGIGASGGIGGQAGDAGDGGLPGGSSGTAGGGGDCASKPELCNGLDDNCNGEIDEGNPGGGGDCTTNKPGECAAGTLQCLPGTGTLTCVQNNQPTVEVCDGKDNNCNGSVDEGNPGGQQPCDTGLLGICKPGVYQCSGGSLQCIPNVATPQIEICNGLDDDCDGEVDELNPQGGQACSTGKLGVCEAGETSCEAGQIKCVQKVQATGEICNNKDDDCNGTIDDPAAVNGIPCSTGLPGVCGPGTTQCVAGVQLCNQTTQASAEKCNGLDDDCNGVIDNGNTTTMCTVQYPAAGNVGSWACSGGNCEITSCQPGFVNQNGSPADGCEATTCVSNPTPSTCSGPTASPALSSGSTSYTFTGQLVTANQVAWWAPSFTAPVPGAAFVPTIQLTLNQGGDYRLDVFYGCTSTYATCPAAGGTGSGTGQNITDKWQMNFANPIACGVPNGACTYKTTVPTNIRVRVTRIKVGNPCNQFTVKFSQ